VAGRRCERVVRNPHAGLAPDLEPSRWRLADQVTRVALPKLPGGGPGDLWFQLEEGRAVGYHLDTTVHELGRRDADRGHMFQGDCAYAPFAPHDLGLCRDPFSYSRSVERAGQVGLGSQDEPFGHALDGLVCDPRWQAKMLEINADGDLGGYRCNSDGLLREVRRQRRRRRRRDRHLAGPVRGRREPGAVRPGALQPRRTDLAGGGDRRGQGHGRAEPALVPGGGADARDGPPEPGRRLPARGLVRPDAAGERPRSAGGPPGGERRDHRPAGRPRSRADGRDRRHRREVTSAPTGPGSAACEGGRGRPFARDGLEVRGGKDRSSKRGASAAARWRFVAWSWRRPTPPCRPGPRRRVPVHRRALWSTRPTWVRGAHSSASVLSRPRR
jgi:hypothetical protein